MKHVPCRVYVILARSAPIGVILRRGPTRWVQVLKWRTDTDEFEAGQWFRGRIYERRCDLSPDGAFFVYFAAKFNRMLPRISFLRTLIQKMSSVPVTDSYEGTWTAVSRPPYLTALALWPKGDCWAGGGLFETSTNLWLNHGKWEAKPHRDHQPKGFTVEHNPRAGGEDYPVWSRRMARDNWSRVQKGSYPYTRDGGWRTERPEIWERIGPDGQTRLRYQHDAIDFDVPGGQYIESFTLLRAGLPDLSIEGARWAEWDQAGRLVFVREGNIFAAELNGETLSETLLIDLNPNKPHRMKAPEWATNWD